MPAAERPAWNPAFLGPLDQAPRAIASGERFFAGETSYYSERQLAARAKVWETVRPRIERMLEDGETVLCAVPVLRNPRLFEQMGLGVWWVRFFRGVVVLTDRRAIEMLFEVGGKRLGPRTWSFPWSRVRKLRFRGATLTLRPASGRKHTWRVTVRADRKLLRELAPRLVERRVPAQLHDRQPAPLWHCPACAAVTEKRPDRCAACGTDFLRPSTAAWLSIAFPGAGLWYAGHRWLALFDFLGEAAIAGMFVSLLLAAGDTDGRIGLALAGSFFFVMTKLESVHVSTMLAGRTRPDPAPGRWRALGLAGAVISAVVITVPVALSGSLANVVERTPDFSANALGWSGGYSADSWNFPTHDPKQQSEWMRGDGQPLFVFSLPLGMGESYGDYVKGWNRHLQDIGGTPGSPKIIAGHEILRTRSPIVDEDGTTLEQVQWIIFDRDNRDLHLLLANVWPDQREGLEAELAQLVAQSDWRPVTADR